MSGQIQPQWASFVDSVTFHALRNTTGETLSAWYSIALFVASDATATWPRCCETATEGWVTLWSEAAGSVFKRQNKERSQCLPSFFSVLQPPPFPSPLLHQSTHTHTKHTPPDSLFIHLPHSRPISFQYSHVFSHHPSLSNHPLHPVRLTHCCDCTDTLLLSMLKATYMNRNTHIHLLTLTVRGEITARCLRKQHTEEMMH